VRVLAPSEVVQRGFCIYKLITMEKIMYLLVRVKIESNDPIEDATALEMVQNMDYSLTSTTEGVKITDSEISEQYFKYPSLR